MDKLNNIINLQALSEALQATNWKEVALAIIVGAILGYAFAKLRLPAPAPLVLAGIAGIIGIWLGYILGK